MSVSDAQPVDVAGRAAYTSRSRRSTTAGCSARSSSPGTPRTACRCARRSTRRAPPRRCSSSPSTDISYGAVSSSDVDVSPPAGAKVVELDSSRPRAPRPTRARRSPVSAPFRRRPGSRSRRRTRWSGCRSRTCGSSAGTPCVVVYGQGLGAIAVLERKADGSAPTGGSLSAPPDGLARRRHGPRARDAARHRDRVAERRGRLRPCRLASLGGGGGCGTDAEVSELAGRGPRAGQALRRDRRGRLGRPDRRARRRVRLPRPERRRQDHVAADDARADPADRRLGGAVRPRPAARRGEGARRRRRLRRGPALLPVPLRPSEPRVAGRLRRARLALADRRGARPRRPARPRERTASAATPTGCASASGSPPRCCGSRACCFSTSPRRVSTRQGCATCATSYGGSRGRGSPSSSRAICSARSRSCATASRS